MGEVHVYPPLTDPACAALRDLPVDVRALGPIYAELEAKKLLEVRDGVGYLTLEGARYVFALLMAEKLDRRCAVCAAPYREHDEVRPYANPRTGCRSFTYGEPAPAHPRRR
jgi:hypothetical protein